MIPLAPHDGDGRTKVHVLILDYLISRTTVHVLALSTRFEGVRAVAYAADGETLAALEAARPPRLLDPDRIGALASSLRALDFLVESAAAWSERGDVVYLSPHGPMHGLPLHLLKVDGSMLIERNVVTYTPSVAVLRLCRRRARTAASAARRVPVVFGDSRGDLPNARSEAVEVARLLGTEAVLGPAVTLEKVEERVADASIIHFAGHGQLAASDPLDASLSLSAGASLTARRIFEGGRFGRDLAVLSGCETGVDEVLKGDEAMGLTRAMLFGGCASVVASLWRVEDRSTAAFMRAFYGAILGDPPASKAAALQAAATAVRAHTAWQSPFFWAAFVLIGSHV